jgi:hypothetical protein
MIIHDINRSGTFAIVFLCISKRHWCVNVQKGLRATLMDPMFIKESEEDEVVKQQFLGGIDNINKRRGEGCCFQSSQQSNTLKKIIFNLQDLTTSLHSPQYPSFIFFPHPSLPKLHQCRFILNHSPPK